MVNYRFVGKYFLGKLKILPNLKLKDMMRLAKQELKVELNKNVCHRARIWANKKIKGRLKDEFNKLFDYTYALREADPNGTFDLFVQRPTPSANIIFRRLHVCFGGLNGGFKKYCRPVLSLDGCYLKGGFKSEILAVVGGMFSEHIQTDLRIGDGDIFTILSDMQKPIERYVHDAYTKETYRSLYDYALPTIPSDAFWKETKMSSLKPSVKRKLPRRPKQKRKREREKQPRGLNCLNKEASSHVDLVGCLDTTQELALKITKL
ncbi:hypothetical protein GQ457_18G010270 [Hibiscus cannabinus]